MTGAEKKLGAKPMGNHRPAVTIQGREVALKGGILLDSSRPSDMPLFLVPEGLRPQSPVTAPLELQIVAAPVGGSYYTPLHTGKAGDANLKIGVDGYAHLYIQKGEGDAVFLDGIRYQVAKQRDLDEEPGMEEESETYSGRTPPELDIMAYSVGKLLDIAWQQAKRVAGSEVDIDPVGLSAISSYIDSVVNLAEALGNYQEHLQKEECSGQVALDIALELLAVANSEQKDARLIERLEELVLTLRR